MPRHVETILAESQAVQHAAVQSQQDVLLKAADLLVTTIASGHKLLIGGNGAGAAQALALAAVFVNGCRVADHPLPAMALAANTAIVTGIGTTEGLDHIFARQVEALGRPADLFWALTTAERAPNIEAALKSARQLGLHALVMTGADTRLADQADLLLTVPSADDARILETHVLMGHILCRLVAHKLFAPPAA
jgi:D-sedoheptulose 7-phosphate isomerase